MAQKKSKTTPKKKSRAKSKAPEKALPTPKETKYKSFRLSKTVKYTGRKLPSSWSLFKASCNTLWGHKKVFGGILLIYSFMQLLLVQGVITNNFSEIRKAMDGVLGELGGGVATFSYMLTTIGQASSAESGIYQFCLFIIASLAFIWALRQIMAGKKIRIRDAYYKGTYPLVPLLLILLVIGLQTIPALIGAWLYSTVAANGIAVSFIEQAFWLTILFLFILASLYMICSSLFAMYIVMLPDGTPMRALRSARKLVLYRRWSIARKLIMLIIILVVGMAIIVLPFIAFLQALAPIMFYIATILVMGVAHTYIYTLYRELLLDE